MTTAKTFPLMKSKQSPDIVEQPPPSLHFAEELEPETLACHWPTFMIRPLGLQSPPLSGEQCGGTRIH